MTAFNYTKFQKWSQGFDVGGNKNWNYSDLTSTLATIAASGYFNAVNSGNPTPVMSVNDVIYIVGSDGNGYYIVTAITPNVTVDPYSINIPAGSIVNSDVNAAAAIDFSKLAALPSTDILVGSAGNVAIAVAMTGDVTIGNTGVTAIGANKVTGPMLATTLTTTAGVTTATSTSSATPGTIRSWVGKITGSNATMTSGNLVGLRGEVDMVGASGGFAYGVQGKVIPTGTLSGSVWAPAVFGQYDLSASTLNAGQIAAVWGDMGASGGTFTDVTGARMFAGTNTIASLTLNAMDYRYGKASNLFELAGDSGTYITDGGSGAPSGTVKKIAITIDGAQYYLIAATVVS